MMTTSSIAAEKPEDQQQHQRHRANGTIVADMKDTGAGGRNGARKDSVATISYSSPLMGRKAAVGRRTSDIGLERQMRSAPDCRRTSLCTDGQELKEGSFGSSFLKRNLSGKYRSTLRTSAARLRRAMTVEVEMETAAGTSNANRLSPCLESRSVPPPSPTLAPAPPPGSPRLSSSQAPSRPGSAVGTPAGSPPGTPVRSKVTEMLGKGHVVQTQHHQSLWLLFRCSR